MRRECIRVNFQFAQEQKCRNSMPDLDLFHSRHLRTSYFSFLLVLGIQYESVFTKLFRHRNAECCSNWLVQKSLSKMCYSRFSDNFVPIMTSLVFENSVDPDQLKSSVASWLIWIYIVFNRVHVWFHTVFIRSIYTFQYVNG